MRILRKIIESQYQNIFFLYPFFVFAGSFIYFNLSFEPKIFYPYLITVIVLFLIFLKINLFLRFILLFIFGFLYSLSYSNFINNPLINTNLRNISLDGIVSNIDYLDGKNRIFFKTSSNNIINNTDNKNINLRLTVYSNDINIGDKIKANVSLFAPVPIDSPNSFNQARWLYFNNLSGIGFINDYSILEKNKDIISYRDFIHKKSNHFLIDSLILGYKNSLPEYEKNIWNKIGLSHIWSISGFHIGIIFSIIYSIFYFILRTLTFVSVRIPAKTLSLLLSVFILIFYLFLSGSNIATIRAVLMTFVIVFVIIKNRFLFNFRNVSIVILFIFLLNPHYIMEPGFQLSFSALYGILWYKNKLYKKSDNKFINYFKTIFQISLITMFFTSPFVILHFNQLPLYSLFANLIILPIFAIILMPFVFLGTFISIIGSNILILFAENIYYFLFNIAKFIYNLPFSNLQMPYISNLALFFIIIGLLLLVMFQSESIKTNIKLFFIFVSVGIFCIIFTEKPLFYSSYNNELVAFINNKKLEFNKKKSSNHFFHFNNWKILNREKINTEVKKYKCKKGVCYYYTDNWNLVYIQRYKPLSKNIKSLCNDENINYIVSYYKINSKQCIKKIMGRGFVIYKSGKIKYFKNDRIWNR